MSGEIKCYSCKNFVITMCCDRPVCNVSVWDACAFNKGEDMDEFLLENSEGCDEYEKIK